MITWGRYKGMALPIPCMVFPSLFFSLPWVVSCFVFFQPPDSFPESPTLVCKREAFGAQWPQLWGV